MARVAGSDRVVRQLESAQWRQEAARIAAELTAQADRGSAEMIIISGDTWARDCPTSYPNDRITGIEHPG